METKNPIIRSRSLASLVALGGLINLGAVSTSNAAIFIDIAGVGSGTTAEVTISGTLALQGITNGVPNSAVAVPVGGQWFTLGTSGGAGRPINGHPFLRTTSIFGITGPGNDTARMDILDTSQGGSILSSAALNSIAYTSAGTYNLRFTNLSGINIPATETGDILSLSGSFDIDLGATTFDDNFAAGTFVADYVVSQDVTIQVRSQAVPEPSTGLFSLLAIGGLCLRRSRR